MITRLAQHFNAFLCLSEAKGMFINMIKTTAMLIDELREYVNPSAKIRQMVRKGDLIPIVRGLYETDKSIPGYYLAPIIYGPSYLSFEFALAYYNLIPEAVYNFTSASFEKKKAKQYETPYGTFTYRDVPSETYPVGFSEGQYQRAFAIILPG